MPVFEEPKYQDLQSQFAQIPLPDAHGLTLADALVGLSEKGNELHVRVEFAYPVARHREALRAQIKAVANRHYEHVDVDISQTVPSLQPSNNQGSVPGVKNLIAVASGKGGVGKSTTSVNLALALAAQGANVGLLDADIYGPSQQQMLGVADKRPEMYGPNMIEPLTTHLGVKMVSMGNLVTETTPMVWRGPMVSGALQQLLNNTHWVDIDYLIIDMPPGTGDIQLTLSQSVPVSGAVIVTTPQDIALLDAKKGIEMFRKVHIPVFGIVENMSMHTCSSCGHQEAIFGSEGGDRLAKAYDTSVLGRLPLALSIREQTDQGKPPIISEPESDISLMYEKIARQVAAIIWKKSIEGASAPSISFAND